MLIKVRELHGFNVLHSSLPHCVTVEQRMQGTAECRGLQKVGDGEVRGDEVDEVGRLQALHGCRREWRSRL
jgi:hypothetical protein